MKQRVSILWMITLTIGLIIAGCSKDDNLVNTDNDQPPSGVTTETTAIQNLARQDEFVQNDEKTFDDQAIEPADYESFGLNKLAADITPLRFGRFITSITKTVNVTVLPGDTVAVAVVNKDITGVFKIRAINLSGDTLVYEKPFNDKATRNIIFKRFARNAQRFWLNWLPVASSLIKGETAPPNNTIQIQKIEMFLPNGDTVTVTDPANQYLLYRWVWAYRLWNNIRNDVPQLLASQEISMRVTVRSASPDTDLVALRIGFNGMYKKRMRLQMTSEVDNLDGTFTRMYEHTWTVHPHRGFFHAGVDAMTRATLYDDAAPYSVSWWGVPYRVVP